ncbi:(+)-menthofuran synthase-like [Chenopodium quinoa]|nr:(+)-menthofuran synthase-like [Chenopodium quinoa]
MSNIKQLLESQITLFFMHPFTALPFFFFFFLSLYKLLFNHKTRNHLPPSPSKLPIIGNLHQIDKKLPHRSLHSLAKKHGALMLLYFGRNPVLVVSSAEAASKVMKSHDTIFANRPILSMFKRLLYNCRDVATAPYGDYWRRMRSICVNQLLSYNRVQAFHNVRQEEIAQIVEEIRSSPSKAVNLSKMLSNFSTDVICRAAFGMKFDGQRDGIDFKELHEKHEELVGSINIGDFIPWLGWINHVNGVEKDVRTVSRNMDSFLESLVQEHKLKGINEGEKSENKQDFVDVLLELQQDHSAEMSLDKDSIKGIILDMFVAGSTTTYATLEWVMSELLRNPTIMESLQKEVREITRDKANITENDLEKMEYLKAVIKETFRLHPPVPLLLPRISSQETQLHGYDIPAKTQVIINAWTIHRDPSFWKEPERFNPERFLNSSIDFKGQHFNLIPFGSGRRGCPGIHFGTANLELVLANFMQKFDWALPEGAQGMNLDMEEHPGLTIHRETPLRAIATPRFTW